MKRVVLWGLVLLAVACAACEDTTIKMLGAENEVTTDNTPGALRFQASNLDNVHDEVNIDWENPEGRASVAHRSLVHHLGYPPGRDSGTREGIPNSRPSRENRARRCRLRPRAPLRMPPPRPA